MARSIAVHTNDPTRPMTALIVEALVLSSVHVLPQESAMLANHRPVSRQAAWVIRQDATETGELAVSDLRASVDWIVMESRRVEAPQEVDGPIPAADIGDWIIELSLVEGASGYGRSQESVRFRTGLSRQPDVEVPVLVDLRPPVNLNTDRLVLSTGSDGGAAEQTVLLSVRRGLDPAALEVEARPAGLEIELEPSGRSGYKAHVRWSGSALADGEITFSLGGESYSIPVIARAR